MSEPKEPKDETFTKWEMKMNLEKMEVTRVGKERGQ